LKRPQRLALVRKWCVIATTLILAVGFLIKAGQLPVAAAGQATNQPAAVQPQYRVPPAANAEIAAVEKEIDATENQALRVANTNLDAIHTIQTLGKLELFDKTLSVRKNEACSFCHMPETGYTGGSQVLNQTTVSYPGSVRTEFSARKPMSYVYATFAPVLHYNSTQADFYGGNFWDMRATGARLQSPSAEQAQGPPTNPVEMGLPDSACVAYRLSQGRYVALWVKQWGPAINAISWPADAEKTCSTPAGGKGAVQLDLSSEDRDKANVIYDQFGLSIASYEASPEVNAFSSKFDAYLAGTVQLSSQEMHGYELFNGQAKCNTCHLSGTASGASGGSPADAAPLFTDFTSSNLGLPRNPDIPYYYENTPDAYGFVANPQGKAYVDLGVGGFLSGKSGSPVPDHNWVALAPAFDGKVQVPTLRNVDQRPYPGFVKSYMHNGYLKSLKEVVHFYNTRDTKCSSPNDPGVKKTCWPQPEVYQNQDTTVGNLGLSSSDEDDIVAFLKTLTDGYVPVSPLIAKPGTRAQRASATR
jgi:cytochrome c peroxidase